MTTTTIAPVVTQKVRATVNQRRFFELQGQLYKSSYSFLGELMQNARRAGATAVRFVLDQAANTCTCTDDGIGVENFQNLVDLATSGWQDEKLQSSEKPFGMGFFSLFYACEEVTVASCGQVLTVTRDDIIQQRELLVQTSATAPTRGTTIHMRGLADEAWKVRYAFGRHPEGVADLVYQLEVRARGFDIPVYFNDVELPAPNARRNLSGEMTSIGFVHSGYVHGKAGVASSKCLCYLQGLPVGGTDAGTATIVHLDSDQFIPVMPDRAILQDHDQQIKRVAAAVLEVDQRFLVEQKQVLSGEEFVQKHFSYAVEVQPELLNDIGVLPRTRFSQVTRVVADSQEIYEPLREGLVSRQEILSGECKVWRDAPNSTHDCIDSPLVLKVMTELDIFEVATTGLDKGHWVFQCTPSVRDMSVKLMAGAEIGRSKPFWIANHDAVVVAVESLALQVTSSVDPALNVLCTLQNDWVVTGAEKGAPEEDPDLDFNEGEAVFYVVGTGSPDVEALSDFRDDNDGYDQEWAENDQRTLNSRLAAISGRHVSETVQTALNNAVEQPIGVQADQICLVRAIRSFEVWRGSNAEPRFRALKADDDAFWQKVAAQLRLLQPLASGVGAADLMRAFVATVRPNEVVLDRPLQQVLLVASGYQILGAGDSFYAVMNGVKADFEGKEHNYLGFFSSEEAALAEVVDIAVAKTLAHHQVTAEAFDALAVEEKWSLVSQAHTKDSDGDTKADQS